MDRIPNNDLDVTILGVDMVCRVEKECPWSSYQRKRSEDSSFRYVLMLVQEGSYHHNVENERITVTAPTLILRRQGLQSYCNSSDMLPFRYISIYFRTLKEMPLPASRVTLSGEQLRGCEEKFLMAYQLERERPFGWRLRLRGIVEEVLLQVFRIYYAAENGAVYPPIILQGMAVIRRLLERTELSVPDVAEECHVSTTHLIRLFKQYLGVTPKKFMDRLRVERACELLQHTDKSMEEIAVAAGFSEARQMRRLFHEIMGVSPVQYRRRM